MNSNIINTYKVAFVNQIENGIVDKFPKTKDMAITDFLYDWSRVKNINETLLPMIDQALNGTLNFNNSDVGGGATVAYLSATVTKLCDIDGNEYDYNNPLFELPTQDFKAIVIGWRDFLLTPPLNSTKV